MEQDNQKFLKKLSDDQQQLEDRLDTLQLVVAGFSGRTDIGKAAETANEVRRVTKELKDCQQQASLYNQRERLFEMPVTQYDKVVCSILFGNVYVYSKNIIVVLLPSAKVPSDGKFTLLLCL